jgi:peptidoglycan lytic transglycosylase G
MSVRGGRGPREDMAAPVADGGGKRVNGYRRTGRYGRGPGDQRRYERYGDHKGGVRGLLGFGILLVVLAVFVMVAMLTVARPIARLAIVPWAEGNPGALRIGFVEDLVREDLGAALTQPAGSDATEVEFTVIAGDTPATLAPRLAEAGLIASERAFLFEARVTDLADKLQAGTFGLAANLTPAEVVDGLVNNRILARTENVTFREGLRIEQMVAKLENEPELGIDAKAFYDLAMNPPDELLADYPWLLDEKVRPKGASLEGFLYPATYSVRIDGTKQTTAEDLIRSMLDTFYERVGQDRLDVPESRGLTFQQILVLASIVEREAVVDEERPLIAGVYQNRLNPKKFPTGLLQSDPTIFYVHDSLKLDELDLAKWPAYVFWDALPDGYSLPRKLPEDLAPYNTYTSKGLPPGPIASPSLASIDAALNPDTKTGYLFFIAKGDGTGTSAFAKTKAEHDKNVAKYGKN